MGLLDDAIKEHLELKRRRGADAGEISRLESEALGPVPRSAAGAPELADTFEPPPDDPPEAPEASRAEPDADVEPVAPVASPPAPASPAYEPPPSPPEPVAPDPPEPPPPVADALPAGSPAPAYEPPPLLPPRDDPPAWRTDDRHGAEPEPEPEAPSSGLFSRLRGGRRSKHDRRPEPSAAAAHDPAPRGPAAYEPPPPPPPAYDPPPPTAQHEPDIVPADDEPDVEDLLEETPDFLEETPEHDRLWFEQRPPRDFNFDD